MGLALALLNALFDSLRQVAQKRATERHRAPSIICGSRLTAGLLLLPAAYLLGQLVTPQPGFWLPAAGSLAINALTGLLTLSALRTTPLSLALPVLQISPLFLLVTAPLITGELPTPIGGVGVVLIAAGTYALQLSQRRVSPWEPWRRLLGEAGTRKMLAVALLWSVSAPLDKVAVQNSSPLGFAALFNLALGALMVPWGGGLYALLFREGRGDGAATGRGLASTWRPPAGIALVGLFTALSYGCQMQALLFAPVPYVIGIKRTSALLGVLWGRLFFAEEHLRDRLLGTVLVLAGLAAVLVATSGGP